MSSIHSLGVAFRQYGWSVVTPPRFHNRPFNESDISRACAFETGSFAPSTDRTVFVCRRSLVGLLSSKAMGCVPHLTRLLRQVEQPFDLPPTFTIVLPSP
jgi:hypothetical protein